MSFEELMSLGAKWVSSDEVAAAAELGTIFDAGHVSVNVYELPDGRQFHVTDACTYSGDPIQGSPWVAEISSPSN